MIQSVIDFIAGLPPAGIYLAIAALAALENIFPPVPADTAAALGGFLAAQNPRLSVVVIWLVTVLGNVGSAIGIYRLARAAGPELLNTPIGKRLLTPATVEAVQKRLGRHQFWGVFVSRCLPVYRSVVPLLSGMLHLPASRVIPAIALASSLFYGIVVAVAYRLGSSWGAVSAFLKGLGTGLMVVAGIATVAVVVFVIRRKRRA